MATCLPIVPQLDDRRLYLSAQRQKVEVNKAHSNSSTTPTQLPKNNKQRTEQKSSSFLSLSFPSIHTDGADDDANTSDERTNALTPTPIKQVSSTALLQPTSTTTSVTATPAVRVVCPHKLRRIQSLPRNKSPFDAKHFHPMLPVPHPVWKDRVLLAIDLDETLIHSTIVPKNTSSNISSCSTRIAINRPPPKVPSSYDFSLDLSLVTRGEQQEMVYVAFRPHVQEFIDFVSARFEVAVFTASHKLYADPIIDALDPAGKLGKMRLYREHCADAGGTKVKDLSLLGRPLHKIALLDNTPTCYAFQPRNGIPISTWVDSQTDRGLIEVIGLLEELHRATDVVDVLDAFHARIGN